MFFFFFGSLTPVNIPLYIFQALVWKMLIGKQGIQYPKTPIKKFLKKKNSFYAWK